MGTGLKRKYLRLIAYLALALQVSAAASECPHLLTDSPLVLAEFYPLHQIFDAPSDFLDQQLRFCTTDWQHFLNFNKHATAPTRIQLIQQFEIKELNEKYYSMSGAEAYLEQFDFLLHEHLEKHPEFGSILSSSYKNHWIETTLSDASFESQVISPLKVQLAAWMKTQPRLMNLDTHEWLQRTVGWASGNSLIDAHFQAWKRKTGSNAADFAEWQTSAVRRRQRLVQFCRERKLSWHDLLIQAHQNISRNQGGVSAFQAWLKKHHAGEIDSLARQYLLDLQLADALLLSHAPPKDIREARIKNPLSTPRTQWQVERRIAFEIALPKAHSILVTDVEGLGRLGRLAQDQWIESGALGDQLFHVRDQLAQFIHQTHTDIFREIQGFFGTENIPFVYEHDGDDTLWFLPALKTPDLEKQLDDFLNRVFAQRFQVPFLPNQVSLSFHYSGRFEIKEPGSRDSFAQAIAQARAKLKN